jgi:septation ring formation regulator EzrA
MSEGSAQLILETVRLIQSDIRDLHEKMNEINVTMSEVKTEVKYTNGRVTKIENNHTKCAGMQAIEQLTEQRGENKVKESKSYQLGAFVLILATVGGIVFSVLNFLKK